MGMKNTNRARHFGLLLAVCSIILGCTTIPTQEMSDARQAVQAAREVGATLHAPDNLNNAEEYLTEATKALNAGYFNEARERALAAKSEAIKARDSTLQDKQDP